MTAPGLSPAAAIASRRAARSRGFVPFLALNAVLFVRPSEVVPSLGGLPIYEVCIVLCLGLASPSIGRVLSARSLRERPIAACLVGLLPAVVLSLASRGDPAGGIGWGVEVAKLLVYYVLMVAVIDTPARLRRLLAALVVLIAVLVVVSLLHDWGIIPIPGLGAIRSAHLDAATGREVMVHRLSGMGIFHDPNDLGLILVVGMALALYFLADRRRVRRLLWAAPIALFGHALTLTHSRGGFLAMLSGLLALLVARFGWRRSLPLAAVVLPVVFALFAGRQTDLGTGRGTSQSRIQLWSDGFARLACSPVFGIGFGRYADEMGHVAHNSFVHAYTELGLVGGTLFFGAFYLAFEQLRRLRRASATIADPEMRRLGPYLMAVLAGYAAGLMSLSRLDVVPTYLVLGLPTAYASAVGANGTTLGLRLNRRLVRRVVLASLLTVIGLYAFIRIFTRWG